MCHSQLSSSVKLKLIQDDDWGNIWVGSEIICLKPCAVVRKSICVLCMVVPRTTMLVIWHWGNLKLQWFCTNCIIKQVLQTRQKGFKFSSALTKRYIHNSNISFFVCIVTSQTRYAVKDGMFTMRTVKDSL